MASCLGLPLPLAQSTRVGIGGPEQVAECGPVGVHPFR